MVHEIIAERLLIDGRPATFAPSPNIGGRIEPTLIVLHDTASPLASDGSISWLCNPQSKVSAHFVVGRDGRVTQHDRCQSGRTADARSGCGIFGRPAMDRRDAGCMRWSDRVWRIRLQ